jgi:N12 class adenine-specific DNA methylase/adenine-specific DNA methylase
MPSNVQALAQMADRAATQITASHESWTDFLKTAARLYKYPYHEQLMIFAQRPDATACAGYELWNEKMRRYIRRGSKGIALIDVSGDRPRIRYVFDVSDTGSRDDSRRPYLWEYRPEHGDAVTAVLEREYEISGEKGLADQLEQIAGQLANEYWQEHQYDILHTVDGSFLEEYDEFNIGAQFRSAAAVSTTYAVLSRCGLEPDKYFELEDFLSIFDFNTPSTVAALGSAVSEASERVLRQIEVAVKKYEREHLAERSATHGEQPDLHEERGLPDSRPDDHGADGEHREIREDAEKIPERTPSGPVQQPAAVGEAVPAPAGDREDGDGAAGTDDAGTDEIGGRDGKPESVRSDALGGPHERPQSAGRGNDSDGAYLQLSFFPSEQEQIQRINEAESEKPSVFSVPAPQEPEKSGMAQADIDTALQEWNGDIESKHAVAEYMREHARDKDTAAFLRAEYGDDLPAFPVTVGRTSTDLPWPKVQRRIAQLIRENRFYIQEEQPVPPDLSGQPITRTGDTITIGNSGASHEVDITLSDEQWAALQRAVPDSAVISLPYKVGDTVYLDDKPFEITDIGTSDIQLRDPALAYPIFRAESRENFEGLLRRDSRNGSITEFLTADLEHADADLREALTSGLLEQRDKEHIAGYFRENEGNTRVAQRLSETYAGTSDTMELTTGETADFFATITGFEVDIHDKYNSRRSARWEEISPILRALYQQEQDGFSHEPVLREFADRDDTYPSTEVTLPGTATQPSGMPHSESGVALPGEIDTVKEHIASKQPAAENFRITDDHLGEGGAKTKYSFNITAIRTLKAIEAEGRTATPEEQETLSRYVGWGGIPQAFDPDNTSWTKEYAELVGALTAEEYEMARASTLNAHYTSPTVIKAIYEAVKNLGFQTGNILEPACGVGNFFGLLPEELSGSHLYGVELDSITGRIAKQLYPNANITVAGFETTDRRDFFDLAVGNVPFGSYKVSDRAYDKLGFPIHDYFFAKTLDQVRPGGVITFVTSRYTMDKQSPGVRRYIAQRAELLGAIRLPSNAFKANAGTEVTTDILFLQKRDRPIDIEPDWVHLGQTEDGIPVNSYFADHPEMVLGTVKWDDKMHGDKKETTCEPFPDADLSKQLHEAVSHIQGQIAETELPDLGENEEIDDSIPADPEVKNYSYTVVDGKVYYRENSRMVRPELNETAKARVMGMVELRDCVKKLIDRQLDEYASDAEIRKTQAELNTLYDAFSAKYGLINSRGNSLAFAEDSSYYLLCSLEVIDEDGKLERKADMFNKRTIRQRKIVTSVDTASEALSLSIAEKARVDMDYMASLTGKTPEALADELRDVIFRDLGEQDPASVPKAFYNLEKIPFVTADEYLSGNVRRKLRLAKALAEMRSDLAEKIAPNIEALEAAQPKDLDASEIEVRLGATWIDKGYIQQFMEELLNPPSGVRDGIRVNYSSFTAEWSVSNKSSVGYNNVAAYVTYGTDRANAYRILEDSLNLRDTRIYDTVTDPDGKERRVLNSKETTLAQQKQQAIKDAFRDWIWKDPERRQTLTKKYNELFNSSRPREYDGRHLVFPGMNPEIKLREHQLDAVAHQLYGGNTLLAHVVGAGKTYEMIAAAMEGKRLGLCQKSLFAVPNHLTEQWASEFLRLYPSANILVTTKKDFEKRNRKKFCARIATGDYDAIIMGHSQFEKIPVSLERQKRLIQEQIWEIENGLEELKDSGAEQFTIKQLERTKKGLEARLKRLNDNSRKDDVVTFEQLGVDRLFVDEAHNYKNLFLYTKMRNVAGLSTTDAQKSSDMFLKCRYLDEITHSRGVVFATGTPVSNSMTELYTMMRYLQYETLKERNLVHFDCWASTFGETVTAIELAPEGTGYRARTRFARFYNLPELMLLFKEAADIKTADQLNLPTPKAVYHNEVAQPSEIQKEMVKKLSERAAAVHSGAVDPHLDNMLKITSDGRKLGLDQRVINPMLPDDPGSKVNMCVNNVFRFWHDGQDKKLTQLVFCDISTPKGRAAAKENRAVRAGGKLAGGTELHALQDASPEADAPEAFSVYSDIRDKLIARGVPSEQIAFIHDADTEVKKKELFAKVRAGQVRVLMGSTAKMGAGMNVQDLLIASHDLDCPWRPGDLEQRSGRIIRQYNTNPEGHIFRYVTEGTFDSYLWQTVENKQKFISQIMTSKSPVRSCEDIDETALSYAEIKALCAGDERIKEKMDLDMDVAKLKLMKANHQSQQFRLEDNLLKYFPEETERNKGFIKGLEADMATLEAHPHPKDGFAGMVVRGDSLTDKDNAGAAILEACKEVKGLEPMEIGSYRGFAILLSVEGFGQDFILTLKGQMTHRVTLGKDARGNLIRIDNALSDMPKRLQNVHAQLDNLHSQIDAAKAEIGKPFPQEAELAQKSARLAELNALLDIDSRAPAQRQASEILEKSERPSVLESLNKPCVCGTGKKSRHELTR